MMTYNVKYMTKENYNRMIGGYIDYTVETETINANSAVEAMEMVQAKYPDYVVGTNPETILDEIIKIAQRKAAEEKEAKAKARKAENEAKKAAEMGMTVAEYKTYKNRQATIRKYKKEIEALKAEIEMREAYIAKYEK